MPAGPSEPGTANAVEPFTMVMAVVELELMGPTGPVEVAVDPFEKVTVPKSASDVSEQVRLQVSGRSTTHSADDCAALEKVIFVENVQP